MPTAAYIDKKFPTPGVSRINPVYNLALCFSSRHFNIITLLTISFLKGPFPLYDFHIRFVVCVNDLVGCLDSSVTIVPRLWAGPSVFRFLSGSKRPPLGRGAPSLLFN